MYYSYVNVITVPKVISVDVKTSKKTLINDNYNVVIFGLFILLFFFVNYAFLQKFSVNTLFWDSLFLSNKSINYQFFVSIVFFMIISSAYCITKQNISFSIEYIFFVFLISTSSFILISSTNLLLSVFVLEFIALLIFGKFTVAKVLNNNSKINLNSQKQDTLNQMSYGLLNSLFFQFWANFVSSIFLFFSLINIHYICGTSNFILINYFFSIIISSNYLTINFITIILMIFATGLFIKLGIAPYQFFKIEVYKGIPIFLVVVYTTLYLIVYIFFFMYLYLYLLPVLKEFIGYYLFMFIGISLLYLVSLLFDTKNFKAFLSYSTLITVVNLFIIILVS